MAKTIMPSDGSNTKSPITKKTLRKELRGFKKNTKNELINYEENRQEE